MSVGAAGYVGSATAEAIASNGKMSEGEDAYGTADYVVMVAYSVGTSVY